MNNRQRIFAALQQLPGAPLTPEQIVTLTARQQYESGGFMHALGIDTVRAALKWLVAEGLVEKHRRRRDFGYSLIDGATAPIDRRTKEARNGQAA